MEFNVGKRITELRTRKSITVNKLATMSGISQSYLRDIELGNKNPTIEIIILLCESLGISLVDFFKDSTIDTMDNDPLLTEIYRLSPKQRAALIHFLHEMLDE